MSDVTNEDFRIVMQKVAKQWAELPKFKNNFSPKSVVMKQPSNQYPRLCENYRCVNRVDPGNSECNMCITDPVYRGEMLRNARQPKAPSIEEAMDVDFSE